MPDEGWYRRERNDSARIRAWTEHYVAKGCHPIKARSVAEQKCHRKGTWPPAMKALGVQVSQ